MSPVPRELRADELWALRGATARRDRDAVAGLLRDRDPTRLLQHAGDALLAVGVAGLEDVARDVERRLRARADEGDGELADALAALLRGEEHPGRELAVDLDDVAELLHDAEGRGGWVDLDTGETWPAAVLDAADEDFGPDAPGHAERWSFVDPLGPGPAEQDRRAFTERLPPGPFRDRLRDALEGRGAFHRFSRVLDEDDDVALAWLAFGGERARGRARAVLAAQGLTAVPPGRRGS